MTARRSTAVAAVIVALCALLLWCASDSEPSPEPTPPTAVPESPADDDEPGAVYATAAMPARPEPEVRRDTSVVPQQLPDSILVGRLVDPDGVPIPAAEVFVVPVVTRQHAGGPGYGTHCWPDGTFQLEVPMMAEVAVFVVPLAGPEADRSTEIRDRHNTGAGVHAPPVSERVAARRLEAKLQFERIHDLGKIVLPWAGAIEGQIHAATRGSRGSRVHWRPGAPTPVGDRHREIRMDGHGRLDVQSGPIVIDANGRFRIVTTRDMPGELLIDDGQWQVHLGERAVERLEVHAPAMLLMRLIPPVELHVKRGDKPVEWVRCEGLQSDVNGVLLVRRDHMNRKQLTLSRFLEPDTVFDVPKLPPRPRPIMVQLNPSKQHRVEVVVQGHPRISRIRWTLTMPEPDADAREAQEKGEEKEQEKTEVAEIGGIAEPPEFAVVVPPAQYRLRIAPVEKSTGSDSFLIPDERDVEVIDGDLRVVVSLQYGGRVVVDARDGTGQRVAGTVQIATAGFATLPQHLDGLAPTATANVPPGRYRVVLDLPGRDPIVNEVDIARGEVTALRLDL